MDVYTKIKSELVEREEVARAIGYLKRVGHTRRYDFKTAIFQLEEYLSLITNSLNQRKR